MADKLMFISNDNTKNYPFCILHFVVETFGLLTNQNSIKFPKAKLLSQNLRKLPKILKQTIKKMILITLGTSVINNPMSPPSMCTTSYVYVFRDRSIEENY